MLVEEKQLAAPAGANFFLFKSDRGGTTLAEDWRPPGAVAARGGSVGPDYTNTVDRFRAFLDDLDADLWSSNQSLVPDATPDPQVAPVDLQVTGSGVLGVTATISSSEASAGKLFGRLLGTEN